MYSTWHKGVWYKARAPRGYCYSTNKIIITITTLTLCLLRSGGYLEFLPSTMMYCKAMGKSPGK